MLSSDLDSTLNRTVFVVIGLMIIGLGVGSLWHAGMMYHNWRREWVFGPFAIVIGILFIVFMFKIGSLERKSRNSRHGR